MRFLLGKALLWLAQKIARITPKPANDPAIVLEEEWSDDARAYGPHRVAVLVLLEGDGSFRVRCGDVSYRGNAGSESDARRAADNLAEHIGMWNLQ